MADERLKLEFDVSGELLSTYILLRNELDAQKSRHSALSKELEVCFSDLQRIRGEIHACLRIAFDEYYRLHKKSSQDAEPSPSNYSVNLGG